MDNLTLSYIIIYVFVFIFGACIGSFLNVCIYRLPKNESLIKRNSHCMTCGEPIKRRDLIPIVSWCILRGKCRSCGAKISARYTIVETLNALLYLWVFYHFNGIFNPLRAALVCLLFSALIVVFFMDWDTQLINTYVVIFIGLLGIAEYIFCRDQTGLTLKSHLIGFFIVSVPLLIICLIITGSIGGLIQKHRSGDSVFAFGPYLSIGIAVAALYSEQIGSWYMDFTGLNEMMNEAMLIIR